jgi:zinc transport system permease protein
MSRIFFRLHANAEAYMFSSILTVSIKIVSMLVLSTMMPLPVATALQMNKGFKTTLILSIFFSIFTIMLGLVLSFYLNVAP